MPLRSVAPEHEKAVARATAFLRSSPNLYFVKSTFGASFDPWFAE
jgi:hypothetical protein